MRRVSRPAPASALRSLPGATALLLAALLFAGAAGADPLEFESPAEEERFGELTAELRCTVCQNQSLADSDAPLAQDLRNEIHTMMRQGDSDEDIKRFLVDRYGDFVLYRPPVRGNTLLLWIAPLLLLTAGAAVMAVTISRRRVMLAEEALDQALEEADGARGGSRDDGISPEPNEAQKP